MSLNKGLKNSTNGCVYSIKPTTIVNASSPAEELKKMKELLDLGIITQEELDAKKKQLLGL